MPLFSLISFGGDQRFELPVGRTLTVGRAVDCDVPVFDPTVSRHHAELTAEDDGDGVRVRDLGSSNGTSINGVRVTEGFLAANDAIAFGKMAYYLRVLEVTSEHRVAPSPAAGPRGGSIVRQLAVQADAPARLDAPAAGGQLRVAGSGGQERQAEKLALLLALSRRLSGELDLDRLLATVADTTFQVLNVDRVAILLLDPASNDLVPAASRSRVGGAEGLRVPQSIARKVVEERVALQTDNAAADERFKGRSVVQQSVRGAMCAPLLAEGEQVLGLLYVDNLATPGSFSEEDLQFLAAFAGIAAAGIRAARAAEQLQREAMTRSNFERYFAPSVAAEIAGQRGAIQLGGSRQPLTVLFSDIRGFTALAEAMAPDAIAGLLSAYFTEMVDVIFEHGGTLDKFIGDAIMALWGAPIAHPDDAERALGAAVGMQQAVAEINRRWAAQGRPTIGVGIGINHGEAFAGNIGSHRRLEYTVIGDAVNIASRLCAAAAPGEILLTESFLRQLGKKKPAVERAEGIEIRGRSGKVTVYRLAGPPAGT
jgi:adenylate cyclase